MVLKRLCLFHFQRLEKERAQERRTLTPAELQAEKIRQRKLQEESELELVKATYGE